MEKNINEKADFLKQLEIKIKNKTTEVIEPIDTMGIDKIKETLLEKSTNVGKKDFIDFFELNYTTLTGDLISVDRKIKHIINRLTANSKCSTMSLTSNILKEWIDNNKSDIEKFLKEQSKLDF